MKKRLCFLLGVALSLISCEKDEILTVSERQNLKNEYKSLYGKKITSVNNNLPLVLVDDFIWGINGHPLNQAAYRDRNSTLDMQLDLIKEHQFKFYRVDINTEPNGEPIEWQKPTLDRLIVDFPNNNIQILPILKFSSLDYTKSEQELYNSAKIQTSGFLNLYGKYFDYIAIGNEEEIRCLERLENEDCKKRVINEGVSGDSPLHYDNDKFKKLGAYMYGVSETIRNFKDSTGIELKTIINCGDPSHSGYYQKIDDYRYNGKSILYDIVGWHWYSNMKPISEVIGRYNKPIWITESNMKGDITKYDEDLQFKLVDSMLSQLSNQPLIKGFFAYELYDEPALEDENERNYGITKWKKDLPFLEIYSQYERKPVSGTMKFRIEESEFGFEDYVYLFYERVNLFTPDINGLNYWTNELEGNRNKQVFLNRILPEKSYSLFIVEQYQKLLDKTGDQDGIDYWADRMKNGLTREQLINEFCASNDFWNLSGGTNEGFIIRLYDKLLNKQAYGEGLNYWNNLLENGMSRYSLVDKFIHEEEFLRLFIENQYIKLFKENGEISGINFWLDEMKGGLNQQDLIIQFLLSQEFWIECIIEGYERKNPYQFSYN